MRILLDTHALIWWLIGNRRRLSESAHEAIADYANDVFVSAVTAWEITSKHRLGRLPEAAAFVTDIRGTIAVEGFAEFPLSVVDAAHGGVLPGPHRDPFDRLLIAQALNHNLTLVSNETVFDSYGVRRLW